MRIKLFLLILLLLAVAPVSRAASPQGQAAPSAQTVERSAEKAVLIRAQTQKMSDRHAGEQEKLLDRMERLEGELKQVTFQAEKTEAYLADQNGKITELRHRLAELDRIKHELEPLLDASLQRLQEFQAHDLPFLPQKRQARLAILQKDLNDYDLGLAAKTARLLKELTIEARYGHTVGTNPGDIQAVGGPLRVEFLRLGRLALFALGVDGQKTWRLDPQSGDYIALEGWGSKLAALADIAQGKRIAALVDTPLGRKPQKAAKP